MFKEAWNNLGSLLYEQKRYKEALKCFDRARKIDPKFDHAARNYAATLFNLERSEKAMEILMDLAEKQPKKYENWEIILTIKADAISRTNSLKEKNWSIIERANHFFKKLKCALKKSLFHWLSLLNGHIHYLDTQLVEEISMFICA